MGHKKRGVAIVINNKDFHPNTSQNSMFFQRMKSTNFCLDLNTRDGTNIDAAQLEGTFSELGFDTYVYHNQTAFQILNIVENGKRIILIGNNSFLLLLVVKKDHSQNDCFIFVMLSHGDDRDIIYGSDQAFSITALTEPFKRSTNSLLGKPKIFIFQVRHQRFCS
jgi:hypothetical protein